MDADPTQADARFWQVLAVLQKGRAELGHLPRVCSCGLIESKAAWDLGERGCPRCHAIWPERLRTLSVDPVPGRRDDR